MPYQNVSQSDTPVDIVMPVYNGAETISQTIDSVLNQTHQAFRLLIVMMVRQIIQRKYVSHI